MNPFNEKAISIASSFQNWKQLYPKPYNKQKEQTRKKKSCMSALFLFVLV